MEKHRQIKTLDLRYVLPFCFEGSFDEAVRRVKAQKTMLQVRNKEDREKRDEVPQRLWIEHRTNTDASESDLFDYIREEFLFEADSDAVPNKKGGVSWLYWQSGILGGRGEKILNMQYFEQPFTKNDQQLTPVVKVSVTNMGLSLYKNNLGLLWYEIEIPSGKMNSDQLLLFQNRIKELNRASGKVCFWEECKSAPDYGIVIGGKNEYKRYMTPILLGRWLRDQISFLEDTGGGRQIRFFAQRQSAYASLVIQGMGAAANLKNEKKALPEMEKDQLKKMLEPDPAPVPDKPLLFSYCLLEAADDAAEDAGEMRAFTFRLANGYMTSYLYSPEIDQQIRQPFENAFWYASQEGAAYSALVRPENEETFSNTIYQKVRTDYFSLYLKSLYQSFSLLIYAQKIQMDIPAILKAGDKGELPSVEPITKLLGEISLFLTKSMATSVSHIHHQSDYYIYLKKRLRIKEDVESVTAGMNALEVLLRERAEEAEKQRDYRMQAILAMFALLGIFSAFADCKGFFDHFPVLHGVYRACLCGIVVISLITIVYVWDVFRMIWADFKKFVNHLMKKNPENGDK